MKRIVLPPGYWPRPDVFERLFRSDAAVVRDDAPFDPHGSCHRTRIKTPHGPLWLTVPVEPRMRYADPILELRIDNAAPWRRRHLEEIRRWYSDAPGFDWAFPVVDRILSRPWTYLIDLNLAALDGVCGLLDVHAEIARASQIGGDYDPLPDVEGRHPVYPQRYGPFLGDLSIVDLLFNVGPRAASFFIPEVAA